MFERVKKILVVEDSELAQKGYELMFRRHAPGFRLVRAMNGREGLEMLADHPDTDLILLDINMPELSGLELLGRCKNEPALAHIPVIIVSTEGEDHDIVRGLKAGAAAYVTKPFAFQDLFTLVSRLLPSSETATSTSG